MVCEACKKPAAPPREIFEESGLDPKAWSDVTFYEGAGCEKCNETGYRGRSAIGELMALSDRIREMILAKRPSSEIRRLARDEGMQTMRESALEKVRQGITTLREINKVTFVE
jgi:type IV pilus assembly protein PilB